MFCVVLCLLNKSAASVVGVGSNRRGSALGGANDIILKEKLSLTVKETANKDAQSVYSASIRSGYLMKRNEQGRCSTFDLPSTTQEVSSC
jgi:hypothetical protein